MTDHPDPIAVASRIGEVLDGLGVVHTIGGSIAASLAGEPRSTIDIDMVAALEVRHVPALLAAVEHEFYVSDAALRRAIDTLGTANLIHEDTNIKVDLFVAGGTPLDAQQLARRQRVEISGHVLYVHPPEDILLQKLRWYAKGAGVSDRQWRDILGIVRTQGERLDRAYLDANAPALGVEVLLARVFAEA